MKNILLAGVFGILANNAAAHSPLDATTPANEAIIDELPPEVLMDFNGDIRLTRVTMTHADHDSVDLDLSGNDGFISEYALPLQSMGHGPYVIEWRGLGADGHALNGTFGFVVQK